MFYVGKEHTTTIATADSTRFVCIHCDYACNAVVTGIGEGRATSHYFIDNSGARGAAHDAAIGQARDNQHWALRGATCPKCGKHDEAARWHVYWTSTLRGLVYGIAAGAATVAVFQGSKTGWWLGVILLLAVGIGVSVDRSRRMLSGAMLEG